MFLLEVDRSVTQGDVIRADARDIPRIFQVNYTINILRVLIVIITVICQTQI